MITADELIERAGTWVGVPFHHQGRSRHGVDCVGLPECVLREAGVLPADYSAPTNYGRRPGAELEEALERWCTRSDVAVRGCLVLMRWPRMARPSHAGIFTGQELIHAFRGSTGVVRHAYREPWIRRTVGYWLLPGVIYE